jgi:hypothetical protein
MACSQREGGIMSVPSLDGHGCVWVEPQCEGFCPVAKAKALQEAKQHWGCVVDPSA